MAGRVLRTDQARSYPTYPELAQELFANASTSAGKNEDYDGGDICNGRA